MYPLLRSHSHLNWPGGLAVAGFLFLFFFSLSAVAAPTTHLAPAAPDATRIMATSQNAIGKNIGDHLFTSSTGDKVRISDLVDRPLVISMVFSACSHTCPVITQTLIDAVAVGRRALGADRFRVVTIGFDVANDTPERMRAFARRQGIPLGDNWQVLSGTQAAVEGLARDIGFEFFPSMKGFDHLNQTTIVDSNGRVFRQIYGQNFESVYLVEPLKSLVFGTEAPFSSFQDLVNKVRLFCTIYDPNADRYQFNYGMFIRIGIGFTIILSLFVIVVRGWRRGGGPPPGGPGNPVKADTV